MHPAERAMSRISAMSYGSGAHGRESSLSAHEGREFADKHGKHHYFKYWSDVHGARICLIMMTGNLAMWHPSRRGKARA